MDPTPAIPFWKSKAFWLGVAVILVSVASLVAGSDLVKQYPQIAASLTLVSGILTIVIRAVTTGPISLTTPKE